MPHPRNHLKQTGDTHPPEVEYDTGADEEPMQPAAAADNEPQAAAQRREDTPESSPPSGLQLDAETERYLDAARAEVRRKPLAYAAGAFAIGFLLAVITRS